ncbi:DUF1353 domain-containing protein [Tellurirhabdus rosea]|uniref:DUF1353 domain-containing protein n=1 Tax=Tellurirhabdus rosea TaxID=2674997 RepID=UPI00225422ED|nr:DUF1353 domain-containing protein [Tellurirhabdus rosea]
MESITAQYIGTEKRPYLWQIKEPVTVELPAGETITIPAGYTTNFASIPKALHSLFSVMGPGLSIAALVHDYMYDKRMYEKELGEELARQRADAAFLFLMNKYSPGTKGRNKLFYRAVRIFGRGMWRKNE